MSIETNKQIVRDAYGAINRGDVEAFMTLLADDVEWYFIGSHRFAGTIKGKDNVLNDVIGTLGAILSSPLQLEIKQLVAEGDKVVAEMQGTSRSAEGKEYNNIYAIILTLRDGKIKEMREYLDTELITEVFGRG